MCKTTRPSRISTRLQSKVNDGGDAHTNVRVKGLSKKGCLREM
ncbi:hypothetical protein ADUPG1_004381, partial [Aduncisulcus paluster]